MHDFVEFRCILFLDTSESNILGESRCIWNIWFMEHTSEIHGLGSFRCIVTLVSVGDTSGLRFRCPSRCTWVQIYLQYTSGWDNISHFRCIAKNCQNKIHRNSGFSSNPDVFQLISREYTRIPSKCIPAQADFNKNIHRNSVISSNPDVSQLISREYTYIPSKYTPAQAGLNKHKYIGIQQFIAIPMYRLAFIT